MNYIGCCLLTSILFLIMSILPLSLALTRVYVDLNCVMEQSKLANVLA